MSKKIFSEFQNWWKLITFKRHNANLSFQKHHQIITFSKWAIRCLPWSNNVISLIAIAIVIGSSFALITIIIIDVQSNFQQPFANVLIVAQVNAVHPPECQLEVFGQNSQHQQIAVVRWALVAPRAIADDSPVEGVVAIEDCPNRVQEQDLRPAERLQLIDCVNCLRRVDRRADDYHWKRAERREIRIFG